MATNGAGKARIRTRTGATYIVRCGDSEYEGPGVDFGPGESKFASFRILRVLEFAFFPSENSLSNTGPPKKAKALKFRILFDPGEGKA